MCRKYVENGIREVNNEYNNKSISYIELILLLFFMNDCASFFRSCIQPL